MATAYSQIILQAYAEVNVIQDTSETISSTLQSDAFLLMQQWLQEISMDRLLNCVAKHQTGLTLVAGTSGYTFGTGGTLTASVEPLAITGWSAVSGNFRTGGQPISYDRIRELAQNASGRVSTLPEALAADQANPTINLEVWPTPGTSPGTLSLDYWGKLTIPTSVSDTVDGPPGFERLYALGLALQLETRYPLGDGPRALLERNYKMAETTLKTRVGAILSAAPQPAAGA